MGLCLLAGSVLGSIGCSDEMTAGNDAGAVVSADGGAKASAPSVSVQRVLQKVEAELGGGGAVQNVSLGMGDDVVEIEVPGNVLATRTRVTVSLVEGVPQRGRVPINNRGVLVEPLGVTFQSVVKVRQRVQAPPAGRRYVAVVLEQPAGDFRATTAARRVGESAGGREIWEGDGTGTGLWGLAVADE